MKASTIIIILIFTTSCSFGQTKSFKWNDSTFEKGALRQVWFYLAMDGPCTVRLCYDDCDTALIRKNYNYYTCFNKYTYDTIATFIKQNPKLKIEIRFNTSQLGNEKYNLKRTQRKASSCLFVFHQLGADTSRIKPVALGETNPLIPESEILKIKNRDEQLKMYWRNNRTEIVILE